MGHTDVETMANVTIAKYDFEDEAFQEISEMAKDFIRKLLNKDLQWVIFFLREKHAKTCPDSLTCGSLHASPH